MHIFGEVVPMQVVDLITWTDDPYSVVYFAGKVCAHRDMTFDQAKSAPVEEKEAYIRKLIAMGHESVLEHVTFTFYIKDVSRVMTHQLVRHRIASYSQLSHRREDKEMSFVIPDSVLELPEDQQKTIKQYLFTSSMLYNSLLKAGVPAEDARYFLPQALTTNIVVTMNARSLRNFLWLRLNEDAAWEIREVASQMYNLVRAIAPVFVEDLYVEVETV
jgi:thymidylate synthase (FAD)